ncbi:MAG: hypothetical protein MUE43_08285, partial [Serpentinimonas sp.]|nr:hypothetical protein [Serpentinimonas sp.]
SLLTRFRLRDDQFADDELAATSSGAGFAVQSDQRHLDEILNGYRAILAGKRVDPVDIRVKSGWWADVGTTAGSCGSAGKVHVKFVFHAFVFHMKFLSLKILTDQLATQSCVVTFDVFN